MSRKIRRYFLVGLLALGFLATYYTGRMQGVMPMLLGLLFLGLAADIWLTHKKVKGKNDQNSPPTPPPDGHTDER